MRFSMEESSVCVETLVPIKLNSVIANNTQQNATSKIGIFERKSHENVDQGCVGKENFSGEGNIDLEIKEIEEEISRLSLRLEALRLEKAKRDAKEREPPKKLTGLVDHLRDFDESLPMSNKLKTPRRGLSLGPMEIVRGSGRRGISLGPMEIYSATKLKQLGNKQEMRTPIQPKSNRRNLFYWKLQEIDELQATKKRGKSLSFSPKSRLKNIQATKHAASTTGHMKVVKKEDGMVSSIQPKKLFVKDGEKSATVMKPVKSGRVVASRYNKVCDGGKSVMKEVKELRKRSLPESEEECRSDKKRVSLSEKSKGDEQVVKEAKEKMREVSRSEVTIQKDVDHKTPSSVSKFLDKFPNIKTLRCLNESRKNSGP